ncbi:MAG: KamA family radical SAM protein [Nitrospinae bacterium CG11_big_fil_rev_8_21_14_0_20_56_8]|nr:MAG: KamA family radical SAM protein [Nitrospinae bacterium CG11_big_fil_rev_8_21_14_0_20_56_8]
MLSQLKHLNKRKNKYLTRLDQLEGLAREEQVGLQLVDDKFVFRSNEYYQSLIDWSDPNDPIRKIVVPDIGEMDNWGRLDASNEDKYTPVRGLEHKYPSTALLLVNEVCAAYCRFCFRKRLFMNENDEVTKDITEGLEYIRRHPEITNVLLTGGDPLILSTSKLDPILRKLREIDHVQIIRIGSKIPAFNPYRIIDDPSLLATLRRHSTKEKRIYIMAHFNHPRELTAVAVEGLDLLMKAGTILVNQTPLIRGVNDNPDVLANLFNRLSFLGVPPYYVFLCRPTLGNKPFAVPVEAGFQVFEQARMRVSGLAKRARIAMSHESGKIEVLGLTGTEIYFKYHRAAEPQESARFLAFKRNPDAFWFDDYEESRECLFDYAPAENLEMC